MNTLNAILFAVVWSSIIMSLYGVALWFMTRNWPR